MRAGTAEMLDRERLATRLGVPMSGIAAFCDRWGVEELALFGSVLRDDFGPDSDIDFLVRFKPGRTPGLFVAAKIRRELANMCRRRVDLVHRPTIEGAGTTFGGRRFWSPRGLSMPREESEYLLDMVLAATKAVSFTESMSFADFARDERTVFSATKAVAIVGVAGTPPS